MQRGKTKQPGGDGGGRPGVQRLRHQFDPSFPARFRRRHQRCQPQRRVVWSTSRSPILGADWRTFGVVVSNLGPQAGGAKQSQQLRQQFDTLEEREAAYAAARARIFQGDDTPDEIPVIPAAAAAANQRAQPVARPRMYGNFDIFLGPWSYFSAIMPPHTRRVTRRVTYSA